MPGSQNGLWFTYRTWITRHRKLAAVVAVVVIGGGGGVTVACTCSTPIFSGSGTTTSDGAVGGTHACPGRSFYIDYVGGSDSNGGTSTTTAWRRAPGMVGFAANYTHQAHDCFYFKGGVSWTNAAFPMTVTTSGNATANDYYGPKYDWFTGGTWTRPIFTAGGSAISGSFNGFINATGTDYNYFDNFEMTGFHWSTPCGYMACVFIVAAVSSNITIDHMYMHGWTHSGTADDGLVLVGGQTGPNVLTDDVIQNSVFDGSDSTGAGDSGEAMYAWTNVKNSVFTDMPNFVLANAGGEISGNLLKNCTLSFAGNHENFLEAIGTGTYYWHDNVIHDGPCEALFIGNNGETAYVWNNVWYALTGNPPAVDPGGSAYFWNNTIVANTNSQCIRDGHAGTVTLFEARNNHCITTSGSFENVSSHSPPPTTSTVDHNVLQTPSAATTDGYTAGSTFAYKPASGSGSTVNTGASLSASCTGSNAGLCSSTTLACAYQTSDHVSVCPKVTASARPQGGRWDVGAYER